MPRCYPWFLLPPLVPLLPSFLLLFPPRSLRSTLCLEYPPDVVCVAVIALSIKYKQLDEPVRAGPSVLSAKPWHEELFGVDKKTIDCTPLQHTLQCV